MNCNDYRELIALYVENDLDAADVQKVEEHREVCASCRQFELELRESQGSLKRLQDSTGFDDAYQDVRRQVLQQISATERPRRIPWNWSTLLVAALMAAAVLAAALTFTRLAPKGQSTTAPTVHMKREVNPQTSPATQPAGAPESAPVAKAKSLPSPIPSPAYVIAGSIFGKVVDERGAPLPGVTVILESPMIPQRRAQSDAKGTYMFSDLPTGSYSLSWELEGFGPMRYDSLQVGKSEQKLLAKMHPSRSEEYTVIGETPVVDAKKTGTSSTFSRESMEDVPSARDPWIVIDQSTDTKSAQHNVGGLESGQEGGFGDSVQESQPTEPAPAETLPPSQETSPPTPQTHVTGAPPRAGRLNVESSSTLLVIAEDGGAVDSAQDRAVGGSLQARDSQGNNVGEFPLRHTDVKAAISGYLATTRVEQVYTNPYKEAIEAVYVFPLPSMAAVNDFVMEIGDRKIIGIVRPREEAERIYQEAKERGQTASLLTQERPNIFTQNVANIEPGGKVVIRITYFERLAYEKGHYEYMFPMVVGPRYIPGSTHTAAPGKQGGGGWSPSTNQVPDADRITPPVLAPGRRSGHDISLQVDLDAGLPVSDIACPTHRVKIHEDGSNKRKIRLEESDSIPNRDFVLRWSVAGQDTQFGVLSQSDRDGGFFTLMVQPALSPADNQVMPREITFILDVSGSMDGIPIEMSKEIVRRTLDRLRPDDIFNVFVFSGANAQLWETPQSNTAENVAAAKLFLQTLQGSGGTEMMSGVRRALHALHDSRYLQMYCFLTDGYVGNEEAILKMIQDERGEARFFAFGIGSSVNRYLIDGIGKVGGGVSHVVLPRDGNQAEQAVDRFFQNIDSPVLVDLNVDWNGLPVRDVYPKKLGDLFAGQTINLIGRFTHDAKGTAFVNARLGARTLRLPVAVSFPKNEKNNPALAPVWARTRIEELSGMLRNTAANQQSEIVKQITDLAVRFRLVSQYTSFVAVDESRVVGNGKPLRILQPVELPEGVRYEGIFGAPPIGQAMSIPGWGITVVQTSDGKIVICQVQPNSVSARSGLRAGAVLKAIDRTALYDLKQMEALMLQSSGNVVIELDGLGEMILPAP